MMKKTDCAEYLGDMTAAIQDMVIVISNWGSTSLDWLQHGVCSGTCNESTTLSAFSNIKIYTKGNVPAEHGSAVVKPEEAWAP